MRTLKMPIRKSYRDWNGQRLPLYCHIFADRYGRLKQYYRRGAVRVALRGEPLSTDWWLAYAAAVAGRAAPDIDEPLENGRVRPGSWNALIAAYRADVLADLKPKTRKNYGLYLDKIADLWGNCKVADTKGETFEKWLRVKAREHDGAAGNLWTVFSALCSLAVKRGLRPDNPMRSIDKPRLKNKDGYRTATELEVARYRKRHAGNPDALFVLNGVLATGARSRSDFRLLGWKNVTDGVISFVPEKTSATTGESVHLPIRDKHFLAALASRSSAQPYFLTNPNGDPWDETRLGKDFRRWCSEAGLPADFKMHGLRKLFATRMANNGASVLEIAAALGDTPDSAMIYIKQRDQKALAARAIEATAEVA